MNRAARHKSRNSIMEYYLTFKAIGRAILPSGSLIVNTILQRQRCRSLSFKSTFATRQANHFEDSLRRSPQRELPRNFFRPAPSN